MLTTLPKITTCAMLIHLMYAPLALAASRTVCLELTFSEARDAANANSPSSIDPGNIRGRHSSGNQTPAVGHLFELWDKDNGGSEGYVDDYIGKYIKGADGRECYTFEWENGTAGADGELNPDVYVKYVNEVRATNLMGNKVRAVDENQLDYPKISWRDGIGNFFDYFVALDCTNGANCDILAPGHALSITGRDSSSLVSERVNSLDTAQRALEVFDDLVDEATGGVLMMQHPCSSCSGIATSVDRSLFRINGATGALNGRSAAHEIGHTIFKNQFDQDSVPQDRSLNGAGHNRFGAEFESSVTYEGWADFIAIASWWDDDNNSSVPMVAGADMEQAQPFLSVCNSNTQIGVQATKGWWDLIDSNNEASVSPAPFAPDNYNISPKMAVVGLDRFVDGTANREQEEVLGGGGDPDGMNLRDYWGNNSGQVGFTVNGFFQTLLDHNCMTAQDNG